MADATRKVPLEHDSVLGVGSIQSRLARVYADALLAAAMKQADADAADNLGEELGEFVSGVLDANPDVESFLASQAVGKKAKGTALEAALPGRTSELLRGLFAVLTRNARLDLIRGVAAAYHQLLDDRAGRVRVSVVTTVELTDAQKAELTATLTGMLKQQPVLDVRVDPNLLGGMVVQIGDRVIDTSVRTRLETIRTLLLDKASSYALQQV